MRPSSVLFVSLRSKMKESPRVLFPAHSVAAAVRVPPRGCPPPTNCNPRGRRWQVWMMTPLFSGHTLIGECQDILGSTNSHLPCLSSAACLISGCLFGKELEDTTPRCILSAVIFAARHYHSSPPCIIWFLLTKTCWFSLICFSFLCCLQGLIQPVVMNVARHGAELGDHVAKFWSCFHS